jgi:hypothetical protein
MHFEFLCEQHFQKDGMYSQIGCTLKLPLVKYYFFFKQRKLNMEGWTRLLRNNPST